MQDMKQGAPESDFDAFLASALETLNSERIVARIKDRDHTVWKPSPEEITNRLGWLDSPLDMAGRTGEILEFSEQVRNGGIRNVLLLGMGGSSLAPEVFRNVFGTRPGFPELAILDTTDPAAVLKRRRAFPPAETLYIVSTKSGGTVETLSLFKYFFTETVKEVGRDAAGEHFAAVTDPGSALERIARELDFRRVFLNDPHIGGRYSALSFFGLVPAALIGVDIDVALRRAAGMRELCLKDDARENPGARLGAYMGAWARRGRDKLILDFSPRFRPVAPWVEQLVAESTGKEGTGILPVYGEGVHEGMMIEDRIRVSCRLAGEPDGQSRGVVSAGDIPALGLVVRDELDLGAEFYRWEFATAVACFFLRVNPFDQPNVEASKKRARALVEEYTRTKTLPAQEPACETDGIALYADAPCRDLEDGIRALLEHANADPEHPPVSYIAIQAYLEPGDENARALDGLRAALSRKTGLTVTVGFGPRYLHSVGQLHKGDTGRGLFIQLTTDPREDAPIPDAPGESGSTLTFGVLEKAQALGDWQALRDAGRYVIRFHVSGDVPEATKRIAGAVEGVEFSVR